MSTKQHPGSFDCYAKLAPDEPYFVLRAKDPIAPALVELWAELRKAQFARFLNDGGLFAAKLTEARACADEMRRWHAEHVRAPAGNDA